MSRQYGPYSAKLKFLCPKEMCFAPSWGGLLANARSCVLRNNSAPFGDEITMIEIALKSAIKKPKPSTVKLPFGLCGCQEEKTNGREVGDIEEDIGQQNYSNKLTMDP
ncbi:hypothetical protein L3X38_024211 [Prunus dulcis]|uniref:Uncharacterized protein n=1 Tax=Prunus dulcis TaxID=3755 RepID=A0AAD4W0G8_PRUDU|nr:hypothetical protein L3X38_024211 [Prunus dulcis]